MSTVSDLSIKLEYCDARNIDKQKDFYMPGDFISGVVIMDLNTSLRVRGILFNVHGQAYTAWEVPAKKKSYEGAETYLDYTEPLISESMSDQIFPKGRHRFAFRLQLPHSIPSTFDGTYGSVIYVARAMLEAEDEYHNTETSTPFIVLRRDPLPEQVYEPVHMTKSKTYFGIEMGKIQVHCVLNHGVAVPGETVVVNAEVKNWSGKDINLIQGAIVLEGTYYCRNRKKSIVFRQYLNKRQDHFDVNLQWGRRWIDVKIQLPPYLPDSGLYPCNIIDIKYFFQFKVQVVGHEHIVLETPLYVGYHQPVDGHVDPKAMLMDRLLTNVDSFQGARQPPMDRMLMGDDRPQQSRLPLALKFPVVGGDRFRDPHSRNLRRTYYN